MPDDLTIRVPLAKTWDDVGRTMFTPEHYELPEQAQMVSFAAANPVPQVFTDHKGQMRASAIPMIPVKNTGTEISSFVGHLASRNGQAEAIKAGATGLVLFSGPSAYISPRWFRKNITAPTFSYVSVQVRGTFVPLSGEEETWEVIRNTVAHMEAMVTAQSGGKPWRMEALTKEQMERYLPMILAFRFEIESIEGVNRLNQEKDVVDMENIIDGLKETGTAGSMQIAALMQENLDAILSHADGQD
ncbi:MAG: FMN-binding negative transcriptional regulator [Kordiimonadaceae bacterium]|nr:FMN-binding negative transcriptional regulator [Kordiimonadaceae bacterium]